MAVRGETQYCSVRLMFHSLRSYCGSVGSGLTSMIVERLRDEYDRKLQFQLAVVSTSGHTSQPNVAVADPFNAVMAASTSIEHTNCTLLVENEALTDILRRDLKTTQPTFNDLNQLVAQVIVAILDELSALSTLSMGGFNGWL